MNISHIHGKTFCTIIANVILNRNSIDIRNESFSYQYRITGLDIKLFCNGLSSQTRRDLPFTIFYNDIIFIFKYSIKWLRKILASGKRYTRIKIRDKIDNRVFPISTCSFQYHTFYTFLRVYIEKRTDFIKWLF